MRRIQVRSQRSMRYAHDESFAHSARDMFDLMLFLPLFRHRVAEAGQGILTNMFEHVAA